MQVARTSDTKSKQISYCLVEAWVSALSKAVRLIFVLKVILNVTHFMVSGFQVIHIYLCTLLDPEVFAVAKVPGRGMAHYIPTRHPLQDAVVPERLRHGDQSQGLEKLVRQLENLARRISLLLHGISDVKCSLALI